MRLRRQSSSGDYTFGQNAANFLVDSAGNPEAVAQSIQTRLLLLQGEWFINTQSGVLYSTQILGKGTRGTYDQAFKTAILGTNGVTEIISYSSDLDHSTRTLTVAAVVNTIYGPITVVTPLSVGQAPN